MTQRNSIKLYNVLFPFWFLLLLPQLWIIVLPGNFLIDSIVLLVAMACLKVEDRKTLYKKKILPIFCFGLLADLVGAALMFAGLLLEISTMGDEWYLTLPAVILSAGMIFVFHYFVIFRKEESSLRLRMALTFAIVTAPYTFMIPSSWLYG